MFKAQLPPWALVALGGFALIGVIQTANWIRCLILPTESSDCARTLAMVVPSQNREVRAELEHEYCESLVSATARVLIAQIKPDGTGLREVVMEAPLQQRMTYEGMFRPIALAFKWVDPSTLKIGYPRGRSPVSRETVVRSTKFHINIAYEELPEGAL